MHKSVLLQETIDLLSPKPGGVYVDATAGAGGHSKEILSRIGKAGVLIAMDKDKSALEITGSNLKSSSLKLIQADFSNIADVVKSLGYQKVDGIIADIGVKRHAKLDMRMDQGQELTAEMVVNTYSEADLTRILYAYGEEPMAKKVANEIVITRKNCPIIWTDQLAEVVRRVIKRKTKIDPATKVFQALRIEVNGELSALQSALPQMVSIVKKEGRIVIISFHSLEDRIVKQFFVEEAKECVCPPEFPKCVCDHRPRLKIVTKKPIMAGDAEIAKNARSRSAKLRAAEKI
jgi:16S rRNA (cytosine1402-N4)-methyltransferase